MALADTTFYAIYARSPQRDGATALAEFALFESFFIFWPTLRIPGV